MNFDTLAVISNTSRFVTQIYTRYVNTDESSQFCFGVSILDKTARDKTFIGGRDIEGARCVSRGENRAKGWLHF